MSEKGAGGRGGDGGAPAVKGEKRGRRPRSRSGGTNGARVGLGAVAGGVVVEEDPIRRSGSGRGRGHTHTVTQGGDPMAGLSMPTSYPRKARRPFFSPLCFLRLLLINSGEKSRKKAFYFSSKINIIQAETMIY